VVPPRIIRTLCENTLALDGTIPITSEFESITTEADVDYLLAEITDPRRNLPIVLCSTFAERNYIPAAPLNHKNVARRLTGLAHYRAITESMASLLSQRLGRLWALPGGAVRLFAPRFDGINDPIANHPLWIMADIDGRELQFIDDLSRVCGAISIQLDPAERNIPNFSMLKRLQMQAQADAELSDSERISQLEAIIQQIKVEKDEVWNIAHEADARAAEAEKRLNDALKENEALRTENGNLRASMANELTSEPVAVDSGFASATEAVTILPQIPVASNDMGCAAYPTRYTDIAPWVEANFGETVVILPRAIKKFNDDPNTLYSDVTLVCQTIEFFAKEYRIQRIKHCQQARAAAAARIKELKIEVGKVGSMAGYDDEYKVDYDGTRRLMDIHAKRGNSPKPQNHMRIYGFWDEKRGVFVIGDAPRHLTNKLTT
jgi:regulator of replication initiation timing